MTLVEFLTAQYDEAERRAQLMPPFPWAVSADDDTAVVAEDGIVVAEAFALSGNQQRNTAEWIAANDPASMLADVAAKRRILATAIRIDEALEGRYGTDESVDALWARDEGHAGHEIAKLLALPFADRPGYDEGWRP